VISKNSRVEITARIVAIAAKAGNHGQRAAISSKTWCTEPSAMTGFAGYSVHHKFWQMAPKIRHEDKALLGPWHQTFNLAVKGVHPLIPNNHNTTRQKGVPP